MRRLRVLVALAAVVVLLGAACGNDGGSGSGTENTSADGGKQDDKGKPTEAQAKAALLTPADLPSGWQEDPSADDEEEDGGEDDFCKEFDTDATVPVTAEAETSFAAAETGPFVVHAVGLYANEEEAEKVMDLLADALEKCKTFTDTDEDMGELKGSFTKSTPKDLGDEALAATLTAEGSGLSIAGDLLVVRRGRAMTMLTQFGVEIPGFGGAEPQAGLLDDLAAKAVAKLEAAA